ncbi:MAG: prenyltransferase/squalene oxidase repeat-containing protein [Gemmatimonadota bacterium]
MTEALLAELRDRRNADGGWPARAGLPSNAESTALARMAFAAVGPEGEAEVAAATAWLLRHQASDGSWSFQPDVPLGKWPTSLAALALGSHAEHRDAVRAAVRHIVDQEARKLPWLTNLLYWFARERMSVELNPSLNGWPWAEGAFSWVEPTAYAVIALKRHGGLAGRRARGRLDEGERMILDRTCAGGGWNHGNYRVLGEDIHAYPDTTAIALLALQGAGRMPEVEEGLTVLPRLLDAHASGGTLALARLAQRAWSVADAGVRERLDAWSTAPDGFGGTRGIALAVLALADAANPFLLVNVR